MNKDEITIKIDLTEYELKALRYYCLKTIKYLPYAKSSYIYTMKNLYKKLDDASPKEWKVKYGEEYE